MRVKSTQSEKVGGKMAKTITLPEKPKSIRLPRITRELVQCQMCGYCIDVCEAHRQTPWESVTARGKIYYLNQLDKRGFGAMDRIIGRKAEISPEFVDAIYKCTGCGNCESICHAKIELVKLWEVVRAWLVQEGVAPLPVHKGIAKKISQTGNSFGESPKKRDAWWPEDVERSEVPDAIMYAGCTGSYRMQHIPTAGVKILSRAGVKVNCLGEDEVCCSSPLLRTGIRTMTMDLAIKTVTKADAIGAKDMVMTCSGCYKTVSSNFGEYYSKTGQNVYHFTQYVDKLIKEKKLPLNNEFKAKVTYHDPCHLGRHSKVYEEPRNILKKIKGIDFVEMEKNKENSRCCGAGGGYKSAFNDFAVNIAAERINDAAEVGAEIIATACPFCVLNLKAGAKKIGSDIKVMDISEILLQVTGPKEEVKKEEPKPAPAPVVEAPAPAAPAPTEEVVVEEVVEEIDEEEYNFDVSPEGLVRRAAWNKKLRCRRGYGEYNIPVAFVKGKVAVYVDMDENLYREELENDGWVILKFTSDQITDGEEQAILIRDTVKEQMRVLKKPAKKRK